MERKIFGKKVSQCRKIERGTLWDFSTSILSQNSKKIEGDPSGKIFSEKKVSQCRKKLKGGSFGLARYGMLRGRTGKTFLVQFARPNGAIIFCRTFKNYFGQFVWIEKETHYNSRVSLHEAQTKKERRKEAKKIHGQLEFPPLEFSRNYCRSKKAIF